MKKAFVFCFAAAVLVLAGCAKQPAQNQNQNQVETQNQGESDQLNVNTQEQEQEGEETETNKPNSRSQNARDHMSSVSVYVEELLAMPDRQGGIGQQVRVIAQEQNQVQQQIGDELTTLENKSTLRKRLFGTDYKAVRNLEGLIEQNQLRIQQLEHLQIQTQNQSEQVQIQAAIEALIQQNTALQEQVQAELNYKSLFGWLMNYFAQ